ncbi:MAG: hypothetical protein WKF30_13530 [Pyrinomonadaceae bacterium]
MSQLIRVVLCVLSLIAAALMMLVAWSLIAELLNARSDLSLLVGIALLLVTLVCVGFSLYVVWQRLLHGQERGNTQTSRDDVAVPPQSLFAASADPGMDHQSHENERSQYHHD